MAFGPRIEASFDCLRVTMSQTETDLQMLKHGENVCCFSVKNVSHHFNL